MPAGLVPTSENTVTYDSLPSQTEFERAAEAGEVDLDTARREREQQTRMSKRMANFAKVSMSLGKQNEASRAAADVQAILSGDTNNGQFQLLDPA